MKLVDLLNIANEGYPDQSLREAYNPDTGKLLPNALEADDGLAVFIVRELSETFEPTNASDVQLCAAVVAMERAALDLAGVFGALRHALDQT